MSIAVIKSGTRQQSASDLLAPFVVVGEGGPLHFNGGVGVMSCRADERFAVTGDGFEVAEHSCSFAGTSLPRSKAGTRRSSKPASRPPRHAVGWQARRGRSAK